MITFREMVIILEYRLMKARIENRKVELTLLETGDLIIALKFLIELEKRT